MGEMIDRGFFPFTFSSVVKMMAACFSETPVSSYECTPYQNPEDSDMKCFVSACFDAD
jgi:hypothetical protein